MVRFLWAGLTIGRDCGESSPNPASEKKTPGRTEKVQPGVGAGLLIDDAVDGNEKVVED